MKVLHVFTLVSTAKAFFNGQFKYLSDIGHDIHIAASPGDISEFCKQNNVKFHPVEIARRIDFSADLNSIKELSDLLSREKYDMIVGHTPKGALISMLAGKKCNVPIRVYYRHGLIYTTARGLKRQIFKAVERLTSSLATHIINVSQSLSDLAIQDHLNNEKKQQIIGSGTCGGIDTHNLFNPVLVDKKELELIKSKYQLNNTGFIIGFCGRLCRDKGIEELVEGFKLFHKRNSAISTKLLLIGGYDQRDILKSSVKEEIETNSHIINTGRIPHSDLPLYYSLMDVFVFPSYREGFGMSVIEASSMEVPILVSRSHGCINSILEGVTGKYINISAKDICDGLEDMFANPNRKKYGEAGREWVTENFDYSVMWPLIAQIYDEIAKK